METKKNPHADIESKRTLFFLVGMAIALLAAILVLQYRTPVKTAKTTGCPTQTISYDSEIPRTVRQEAKLEKPKTEEKNFNENLPPEEVPDPTKLDLGDFIEPNKNRGENPIEIDIEPEAPEIIDIAVISKIARPLDCESAANGDLQRECFSRWMQNFVNQNARYPKAASQMKLQDKVYVTMVFDEFGHLESAEIARGKYPILNEEALRVVNSLPQLLPASQNGKKARMRMTVPVNFRLN